MKLYVFFIYIALAVLVIYLDSFIFNLDGLLVLFYYAIIAVSNKSLISTTSNQFQGLSFQKVVIITIPVFCFVYLYGCLSTQILKQEFINRELSLFNYLKAIILFPVLEELVFRGVLFQKLRKLYPNRSIIILSLGFAICHIFTDSGLLPVFLFSLYITWIYLKAQNIYLAIFLHILANSLGLIEGFYTYPENKIVLVTMLVAILCLGYMSISKLKSAKMITHQ